MQALLLKSAQLAQTKTGIEGCSRLNATHPLVILARSKVEVVVVVGGRRFTLGRMGTEGKKIFKPYKYKPDKSGLQEGV